jgi:ribosomal protein S18 acetylase RimI-like enzyme
MAAPELLAAEITDLRHVGAADLAPVLESEVAEWREALHWDFRPSADLVLRFVASQALHGYALRVAGEVAGYTYVVSEEGKGLIGDLYVRSDQRTIENENLLLSAALESLFASPLVRRIESQLMMLCRPLDRPLPRPETATRYSRRLMAIGGERIARLRQARCPRAHLECWSDRHSETAARLIAEAYRGHIDSRINDQYRSLAGARRFLYNIVQYPGCGVFLPGASFVATAGSRALVGLCLASRLSDDVGHITQLCVAPHLRGLGLGYELLRRSLAALTDMGCRSITLTVTSANRQALALYESVGFTTLREFAACVWERPPAGP